MKQLAFDFSISTDPTLDNFVVGCNAELVERLSSLARGDRGERFIYLWGAPGSGRTHLLRAAIAAFRRAGAAAEYRACTGDADIVPALHELRAVAIDDVDRLSGDGAVVLFNLYNVLRESGGVLIAAGSVAPAQLNLRADVASRLAWGLVYEVRALSDAEKARALAERAEARGFTLQPDVSQYLLTHARRDMPALLATLDALDRYSLEAKRPVTVPLLRELLAAAQK
ncbi:MAG TPA: DnaA regulatory inactivator Hda [Burkholderiales bacterium]|nr:DnaA regulatory inactivator Hda [Burkholderiales bacterium]